MVDIDCFTDFAVLPLPCQLVKSKTELFDYTKLKFWSLFDVQMMRFTLGLANMGGQQGEIPVGAVLVHEQQVIGQGFNQPILCHDPTAHAEIVALRQACQALQNYRLPKDTTLYVTLEPCTMCFGALVHARVGRIVFGTHEPKSGVVGSRLDLSQMDFYNHLPRIDTGLLQGDCACQLSNFFSERRRQIKISRQKLPKALNQDSDEH